MSKYVIKKPVTRQEKYDHVWNALIEFETALLKYPHKDIGEFTRLHQAMISFQDWAIWGDDDEQA